ncbi:hypothetical protein I316_03169 [Kwoniella heveanensis BCC8398]|uniref:Uncharacterized protein n=1 Tax=Kwoniella heveanensis BCC8398 TaxID=1296120 RepID=A0A1B9GVS2_9TREE|nr:hypothetical protein I316_03169 [Kwoniella heveanensis BCC8398]
MASLTSRQIPLRTSPALSNSTSSSFSHPFNHTQSQMQSNRMTTPLAPPPPPPLYMSSHEYGADRQQTRYAGADHTLGPTFSEEEDGDDSAFIAAKMAALGLDPNGVPYRQGGFASQSRNGHGQVNPQVPTQAQAQVQRQIALQQLAQLEHAQQQQALFQLLAQQQQHHQRGPDPQLREAMAILEIQQAQQAATERHAYVQQQQQQQQQAQRAYAAQRQNAYDQKRAQQQQVQQQQQQQQLQQMQYLQEMHLQQQLTALQSQPQLNHSQQAYDTAPPSRGNQRHALAAQMQANLQARTGRVAQARGMNLDDVELRARFEAASIPLYTPPAESRSRFEILPSTAPFPPSTSPTASLSPTSPSAWRAAESPSPSKTTIVTPTEVQPPPPPPPATTSIRSPKGGRFSQARKEMEAEGDITLGTLTSTLSGRSLASSESYDSIKEKNDKQASPTLLKPAGECVFQVQRQAQAQPVQPPAQEPKSAKYTLGALGLGRPSALANVSSTARSATLPAAAELLDPNAAARSVSQPILQTSKVVIVRQPMGPPGEAKELGDKNFQSRLRRQAGLNLGMLGRRTESPCPTPVLA